MRTIGLLGWAVILGAWLAWEGVGLVRVNDGWPTMSDIFRAVTRSPIGRWILFALWLWLGWHLFIRGWQFFLRGQLPAPKSGAPPGEFTTPPVSFSHILRQDIIPLFATYALIVSSLFVAARRALSNRDFEGDGPPASMRATLRHIVTTCACGYVVFLLGLTLYYVLVAHQTVDFMEQALWGGAFLAFAVAVPVFAWISYRAKQKAERVPERLSELPGEAPSS